MHQKHQNHRAKLTTTIDTLFLSLPKSKIPTKAGRGDTGGVPSDEKNEKPPPPSPPCPPSPPFSGSRFPSLL